MFFGASRDNDGTWITSNITFVWRTPRESLMPEQNPFYVLLSWHIAFASGSMTVGAVPLPTT